MIARREFLSAAASAATLLKSARRRTNVIFFLTDDHGAWALNCYGCPDIHTPNLDRLADGGTRFTRAFACTPVCSASRLTYMTGRLPSHHGVQDWLQNDDCLGPSSKPFLEGQPTFSAILAQSGYKLGLCGKWHMGQDEKAHAGFTYWCTVPGGGGTFRDPEFIVNGKRERIRGFKEDILADHAIEFINRNKDQPFFLFVPFFAPHIPYNYQPEEYRAPYANSTFSCFPDDPVHQWHTRTLNGSRFPTLNDFHNRGSKLGYSALVTGMDHNVGRILRRVEELGMREETLVVFSADQGHNCGHHGIWGKGNSTVPFNLYDGSLRVPLIWNHPGRIPAGKVLNPMVSSYDFFSTILDYLGVRAPADPKRVGRSYAAFLRGRQPGWRNELYFEYAYVRGIRTENLKYIERTNEWPSEVFDLEADPGERTNVLADARYSKQATTLRQRLATFYDKAGAAPVEQWRQTTTQRLAEYAR